METNLKESILYSLKVIDETAEKMELQFGASEVMRHTNNIFAHSESIRQELAKYFGE
jgi:hypothetical protein